VRYWLVVLIRDKLASLALAKQLKLHCLRTNYHNRNHTHFHRGI
jgi:hypothetical protein